MLLEMLLLGGNAKKINQNQLMTMPIKSKKAWFGICFLMPKCDPGSILAREIFQTTFLLCRHVPL